MSLLWVTAAGQGRDPEDEDAPPEGRIRPTYRSHYDVGDCWDCDTHGDMEIFHDGRPPQCVRCGSTNVEIP